MIVCHIAMAVSRVHSFQQFSLNLDSFS